MQTLEKPIENPNKATPIFDQMYNLIDQKLAAVIKRRGAENGLASFLNDLKACDQFDLIEHLKNINVPMLAICGDQDVMTPPKCSTFLVENVHGAKQVIISGGTHMVFAEKPNEVNQAIETFLEGI